MAQAKKILVVEDEIVAQKTVKAILENSGYDVAMAPNGQEGLQAAGKFIPDLIITDILMPVMDGFQFYKQLKSRNTTQDIPVIVLTARSQMEDTFRVLGVDSFLTKPLQPQSLLDHIQALLKKDETRYLANKKVLLAGSIRKVLDSMTTQLRETGSQVNMAMDVKELVGKISAFKPDYIVTEAEMNALGVKELIGTIRRCPEAQTNPLFIYHYHPDPKSESAALIDKLLSSEGVEQGRDHFYFIGRFREDAFLKKVIKCLASEVSNV